MGTIKKYRNVKENNKKIGKSMWKQKQDFFDLAVEARESFIGDGGEISGVVLEEETIESLNMNITTVEIINEQGVQAMKKPMGTYITLESPWLLYGTKDSNQECSQVVSNILTKLLPLEWKKMLVVGLGNKELTVDTLGPKTMEFLHISPSDKGEEKKKICAISPGVMAQTGMETAEIILGIVKETKPDCVIAIDALAARSVYRLGTTIQMTDTGIEPGSGVGNHRLGINEQTLKVPVIAIGVPTVVAASTIACDTLDAFVSVLKQEAKTSEIGKTLEQFDPEEKHQLLKSLLPPQITNLFVAPKDMDDMVHTLSHILSEGINLLEKDTI